MGEKEYWLGFSVFPGIGSVTFKNLLMRFMSAKIAWEASAPDLKEVLKEKKTRDFVNFRETFDFDTYKKRLEKANVSILTLQEPEYPSLLKQIDKPPFVLYVKGNMSLLMSETDRKIAVVGTRKITHYGEEVTEMFTTALVAAGCTIVSGLAMGVDAIAHQATMAHGGKTIAVLGCGVDCCYPRENQMIYDAIISAEGAIISEIPLGMSANIGTFPARNRIVAGLSQGVLVTEGAADSGSLITADFAIEYKRNVFAVPGPITSSLSKGPYTLIEKGALLVTKPQQILDQLGISEINPPSLKLRRTKGDTEEEQMIIDLLQNESMSFDEIVRIMKKDSAILASVLSIMEIKGMILVGKNGMFSLAIE